MIPSPVRILSGSRVAVAWGVLLFLLARGGTVKSEPRWVLVYGRQYGEFMTGGVAGQVELFAFHQNGRPAQVGMTNVFNLGTAIFGITDQFGNSRVTFDINNRVYDFQVHDPGVATDASPDCYWLDSLPHFGHYRFEFHWRYVQEPDAVTAFPFEPAYHYDLVDGFNQPPSREPGGFSSDAYGLSDWDSYQAQTFVVPPGQNRILAAKAFCVRQHAVRFTMRATIREGGPTGPQIGPSATSREVFSNEFPNVVMSWGLNDVPVVPGRTYALRLDSLNGQGFNVYATQQNTYRQGVLYNGSRQLPTRDMIAVVIGIGVNEGPTVLRGDCNQDLGVDLSDAVTALGHLFLGEAVDCVKACDADDTGVLDLSDAVYQLQYLFLGGSPLPPPFPECAPDTTEDTLTCERSSCDA